MSKYDGGPVFPSRGTIHMHDRGEPRSNPEKHFLMQGGMSLRDYFAAHALGAITVLDRVPGDPKTGSYYASVASYAYAVADAMLAEREKGDADV